MQRWRALHPAYVLVLSFVMLAGIAHLARLYLQWIRDALPLTPFFLLPTIFCAWRTPIRWVLPVMAATAGVLWYVTDPYAESSRTEMTMVTLQLVTYALVGVLITHSRLSHELEWKRARHDSLTGLLNLFGFTEEAWREIDRMKRYMHDFCAVYLDLDHFKELNDSFGHAAGDVALRRVSDVMRSCTRATDLLARLGGDEFIIVMPETDHAGAQRMLDRLQRQMVQQVRLTASIGCVVFRTVPPSVEHIIRLADIAMYRSKSEGKARVSYLHNEAIADVTPTLGFAKPNLS
jgi:diguanylate cyclase (GGDEF)-like protein